MPHEWPSPAPSADWRTRCDRRRPPRLLGQAAAAFVDRAAIDWSALLSRARSRHDRARFADLSRLDQLRGSPPAAGVEVGSAAACGRARVLSRIVVAIAALQTGWALAVVGFGVAGGATIDGRGPQLVLTAGFAAAALALAAARSRDPRSLFLLAAFACAASAFARGVLTGLPQPPPVRLFDAVVRSVAVEAFLPVCVWLFALDFPRVRRFTAFDGLARRAAAAAGVLAILLVGVNLLAALTPLSSGPWEYVVRGQPERGFWRLLTLALAPAVAAILLRARHAPLPERRRVAGLAYALAVGTAPLLVLGLARIASPTIDAWFVNAGPDERAWLDGLIVASLAATPILCTGAVIVDRPFALARRLGFPLARVLPPGPMRRAAAERRAIARAIDDVRLARGIREIVQALERALGEAVGASRVRILVPGRDGTFREWPQGTGRLGRGTALVALLADAARPIDLSPDGPLRELLPARDRRWIQEADVYAAAPLARRDGSPAAIALLGPKRGGARFDRRDRWVLQMLTAAAATAWAADERQRQGPVSSAPDEAAFECPRCGLVGAAPVLTCGHDAEPILASLPHRVAGTFRVRRRIGTGGMGVVYLAYDERLGRDVALKTLSAIGPRAMARLRDEARAMAAARHDALAAIHGLVEWRGTPVLVVEYVPAGTLADRLASGPLPPRAAVAIGVQLAGALASLHARGMLHGDVKPANVALAATGAPRLLDLGLATVIAAATAAPETPADHAPQGTRGPVAGTPGYLPPEAHWGALPTAAFDLWGLSVTLLEAITGINPFGTGGFAADRASSPDALVGLRHPAIGPELIRFFDRALALDPASRYASALELGAALERAARSPG